MSPGAEDLLCPSTAWAGAPSVTAAGEPRRLARPPSSSWPDFGWRLVAGKCRLAVPWGTEALARCPATQDWGATLAFCLGAWTALLPPACRRVRSRRRTASPASANPLSPALGPAGQQVGGPAEAAPQSRGAGWAGLALMVLWASYGALTLERRPLGCLLCANSHHRSHSARAGALCPTRPASATALTWPPSDHRDAPHHPFSPCSRGHPRKWHRPL